VIKTRGKQMLRDLHLHVECDVEHKNRGYGMVSGDVGPGYKDVVKWKGNVLVIYCTAWLLQ
jgi:hypothetical protein